MRKTYLIILFCLACQPKEKPILIFVASSMAPCLEEIAREFNKNTKIEVQIHQGASGVLAQQISLGAPADLFISAHPHWIAYLQKDSLLSIKKAQPIARNRLVLLNQLDSITLPLKPKSFVCSKDKIFGMADPRIVPLGDYTQSALKKLDQWPYTGKFQNFSSARQIEFALENGEIDCAILYQSYRKPSSLKKSSTLLSDSLYPTIEYQLLEFNQPSSQKKLFLSFLLKKFANGSLDKYGFNSIEGFKP